MRKKILIVSILAVFMLITISIVSANNTTNQEKTKKELNNLGSPLFQIRTQQATQEKITPLKQKVYNLIKNRFENLENRMFFYPSSQLMKPTQELFKKLPPSFICTELTGQTCRYTHCLFCK